MIVVTGAAGFIGSCLIGSLNEAGHQDIIAVDHFNNPLKSLNLLGKKILLKIEREQFFDWVNLEQPHIDLVYHFGARTDTVEESVEIFNRLNFNYSKKIWKLCSRHEIPLIYASSAATYGDGSFGYREDRETTSQLEPLNEYAKSKHRFDLWALEQLESPSKWCGMKFFNVFGPNEYHKGKMASMVYQAYQQIVKTGKVKLFRSYDSNFSDGEQKRDFVYVKDVIERCIELLDFPKNTGLLNVGTGTSKTFNYLITCIFQSLQLDPQIEYVDMPNSLKEKYQYRTEAHLDKNRAFRMSIDSTPLEVSVEDYIQNYLVKNRFF